MNKALNDLAKKATLRWKRRRDILFLEACVSNMLATGSSPEQAADVLETFAKQLREWR